MASSPNGPEHTVAYSGQIRAEIKELAKRARQHGLGQELLAALKIIDFNLRRTPIAFGDPWHQLSGARLIVYARIVAPLVVTYAVHMVEPIVFIRQFRPFPSSAF